MATQQTFLNAYEITVPTGGSFSFVVKSGALVNNGSTTVSDSGTDNTAILGDVTSDAITVTGLNNGGSIYQGVGTVNGVQGVVVFDSQAGGKYFLLTSQTYTSTTLTGSQVAATGSGGVGTWTLAGTTPVTPVITTVGDNAGATTGNVANGTTTDDNTLTLTGTAGAGSAVKVFNNGVQVGTATTATDGTWSFTTAALADGNASFTASATSTAGVASATSVARTATVDATPPTLALNVVASQLNAAGTSSVTFTFSEAPAGFTLADVTATGGSLSSFQQSVADPTGKTYTATFTPAANFTGTASVSVAAGSYTDGAGNNGGAGSDTVAVDTQAPAATTTIALVADTGTAGDGISSNPALTGSSSVAGAGQIITIKDGGTVIGTVTTAADGSWTFANAGASQASHSYTAAVTDTAGNLGAATATTPASSSLDTSADSNVVVALTDATAGPAGASIAFDLSNLDAGSTATVTFTGADGGTVSQAYTANGAQTADISGLQGNVAATVAVTDAAGNTAAGGGDTLAGDPVCFYPGTLVRTPAGDVAVEALQIGDLVLTHDGRVAPIRWMGRQSIATRFADPLTALPIRIQAGALAERLPERDLLVSPGHALLLQGVLVQAGALVNGSSIRRETAVPEVFTYHHVELADHALILAEGVPAESYVANVERLAFDNAAEHAALYGAAVAIPEMDRPRAMSHRQVPMALRQHLAARAVTLNSTNIAA